MAQVMTQMAEDIERASTISTSIVIPAYNEEEAIAEVVNDIKSAMTNSGYNYEIIVVDDCSKDDTVKRIPNIEEVRIIRHKYNKGGGAARTTGILRAKGEFIVVIDGDGTYPCHMIPELLS